MDPHEVVAREREQFAPEQCQRTRLAIVGSYSCAGSEIDNVAAERLRLTREVRASSSAHRGMPVEAITWQKLAGLRRLAVQRVLVTGVISDALSAYVVGVLMGREAFGPQRIRGVA